LKNGQGSMQYPNGEVISCGFKNNLRHGRGFITDVKGKEGECLYFNDCEVRLGDQNPDCFGYAPVNFFLSLISLILFGYYYVYYDDGALIFGFIFYIIMLIETCCSSTNSYLRNIISY
jgi:hypothetical protein